MFSSRDITSPSRQPCYFSLTPGRTSISSNNDTPLYSPEDQSLDNPQADPTNPLLAIRPTAASPSKTTKMNTTSLLQLQTQAAHQPVRTRPQPRPVQDVHRTSSDDSDSSNSNDSTGPVYSSRSPSKPASFTSSMATARCSRCHRTPSIDIVTGKGNMIEYGLNLFYCTRCANIVGFCRR
ncbi:hypothetical protein B9Z65_8977 [Elsinoe australis]|uniref:Uncharacterized protein n=1 Tax=Elsinoe australis TaxID=40998 RepID=A0A2P8ABC6_9PEZI|nr:hypothetical protein B9Z65_8977 [Elsinoe australis]